MEYEKIKMLMEDMGSSKLTEMNIEFQDGTKISMKRNTENIEYVEKSVVEKIVPEVSNEKDEGVIITSPMVGTFYSKPSPSEKEFINIGESINKGKTVCIIEAMKLMNEIESEYSGKIVEVYVNDGDAVEYGTKLFRLE